MFPILIVVILIRSRTAWLQAVEKANGVIFVVDSTDTLRLSVAQVEIQKLATSGVLGVRPLVIAANKQDLPSAMSIDQLSRALGLASLPISRWSIVPCSAVDGSGVFEVLQQAVCLLRCSFVLYSLLNVGTSRIYCS